MTGFPASGDDGRDRRNGTPLAAFCSVEKLIRRNATKGGPLKIDVEGEQSVHLASNERAAGDTSGD